MNDTCCLFTESFPYGNGETFLETEIYYLCESFREVLIVPYRIDNNCRTIPDNAKIIKPEQNRNYKNSKLYYNGVIDLVSNFRLYLQIGLLKNFKILGVFKSIKYIGVASEIKKEITKKLSQKALHDPSTIFYTYWFGFTTFSLIVLKASRYNSMKVISRAHGFDLYEERGEKPLRLIRNPTLKGLLQLYLISDHGKEYITRKYPEYQRKYEVSKLGIVNKYEIKTDFENRKIRIVSCSNLIPVKCVDRIILALEYILNKNKDIQLEWNHIGTGREEKKLKFLAKTKLADKMGYDFKGQMTNKEVILFYLENRIDAFINVSLSEGIPVSIMEAQSFGIPVIATAVGGVPEIVTNENGILLSENPTSEEIADAIHKVYLDSINWNKKRKFSRANWTKNYNAEKNYREFSNTLRNI